MNCDSRISIWQRIGSFAFWATMCLQYLRLQDVLELFELATLINKIPTDTRLELQKGMEWFHLGLLLEIDGMSKEF